MPGTRRARRLPKPAQVERAAVFFSRGLGDHILALPAMRALGRLFPGKLSLLVSHSAPDLFFGDAGLARIVEIDMDFHAKPGQPLYDVREAAATLGQQDLLLSIIPTAGREWGQLAKRLRPRWTVGLAEGSTELLRADATRHSLDQAFVVPKAFRPRWQPEEFADPFPLPVQAVRFVQNLRAAMAGKRLLVIHGETKLNKRWPALRWREALTQFMTARPEYVAVELCRNESMLGDPPPAGVLQLSGLPLASAIALSAGADMVLTVDSVFLHAADLWRTPTVALFGPTSAKIWGARFNPMCVHVEAPGGAMENLRSAKVAAALRKLAARIERDNYRAWPLNPAADPNLIRWQ